MEKQKKTYRHSDTCICLHKNLVKNTLNMEAIIDTQSTY